ncbi:MAG: hypothetical protein J6J12_10480 [Oscillospiraceae bacterium]|nr:hypothetical protein [Oscillospiraceae bacterium]
MRKDMKHALIALGVLLAVYFLLIFVIPFPKVAERLIGVGFTLIAFAVAGYTCYVAFLKKPDARSRFYGFPLAKLGFGYLAFQVIAGVPFMIWGAYIPWWVSVAVFAVALAAVTLGLISVQAVVEEIHVQDVMLKKDVKLMRSLQSKVNQMAAQCDNPDAAAAVKQFAEEMRYSDPVSSDSLTEIEADLSAAVDELQAAIADGDSNAAKQLCRKAAGILSERNRLCKLNK